MLFRIDFNEPGTNGVPGWQRFGEPLTRAPTEAPNSLTLRMLTPTVEEVAKLLLGMSKRMSPPSSQPDPQPHVILPLPPSTLNSSGLSRLPYRLLTPPRPRTLRTPKRTMTMDHLLGPSLLIEVTRLGEESPNFCSPPRDRPASGSQLVSSPCDFSTLTPWNQSLDPLALEFVPPSPNHVMSWEDLEWLLAYSRSDWEWSASSDEAGPDTTVA
jgi:hypothetical protein